MCFSCSASVHKQNALLQSIYPLQALHCLLREEQNVLHPSQWEEDGRTHVSFCHKERANKGKLRKENKKSNHEENIKPGFLPFTWSILGISELLPWLNPMASHVNRDPDNTQAPLNPLVGS